MAIADDNVDPESVQVPRRWNIKFIRNFMVVFGLVSSAFDYITFGLLLFLLQATPEQFRTGWFVESLMTELVVALVVRTRRPFFKSKPGRSLWISTLIIALVTVLIPYMPYSGLLGFTPLAPLVMTVLMVVAGCYVAANEVAKKVFYAHVAM